MHHNTVPRVRRLRAGLALSTLLLAASAFVGIRPADAAGTPPTVEFSFHCAGSGVNASWTVTNVDGGAHQLDVQTRYGGAWLDDEYFLAAGDATGGLVYGIADGSLFSMRLYEDGVLLGETPLMVANTDLDGCWKPWEKPSQEPPGGWGPPGPPTVAFVGNCDGGVQVVITNVDGLAHSIELVLDSLEPEVSHHEDSFTLAAGTLTSGPTWYTGEGSIIRFVITADGTDVTDSGWLLVTGDDPCTVSVAPVDDDPPVDEPPVDDPETDDPETTPTTLPGAPSTEVQALGSDRPAAAAAELPRTGAGTVGSAMAGGILLGGGFALRRTAKRLVAKAIMRQRTG